MKRLTIILLLITGLYCTGFAQTADAAFHSASKLFIDQRDKDAAQVLDQAIRQFPNDARLKNLRNQIKEDEKKEQEKKEQEKKEQEKKEQEKKEQEKKEQEKKEQEKKDQEKKDQQNKDQKDKSQEEKEKEQKEKEQQAKEEEQKKKDEEKKPSPGEKMKEMNITPEKAKMILEAMKNQEAQYLQQNKRKATKPKEKGKPDW